ncbi:MAG: fibronectin type III domain-containing protein [Thaumarchaeota archaeon]|nr:fibronectin type III domain-containing protein [Nitrososphaerota archaeon]
MEDLSDIVYRQLEWYSQSTPLTYVFVEQKSSRLTSKGIPSSVEYQIGLPAKLGDTQEVWDRAKYLGYAGYLVAANPPTDYYGAWVGTTYGSGNGLPQKYYIDAVQTDVGVPTRTVPTGFTQYPGTTNGMFRFAQGTDPQTGATYDILARDFTKSLVLVKPRPEAASSDGPTFADGSATSHTLPVLPDSPSGRYYKVNYDGTISTTPITSITLRNAEGAILIKESALNDTTPPLISNVRNSTITNQSAIILWSTDEASTSVVYYGTTSSLGMQKSNANLIISHNIQLTGLTPTTLYYYKVSSCDAAGNCANSSLQNFTTTVTTQACSDGTLYGQCSATKPKYCQNGSLVDKCSACSCSTGQNCNATSQACYTPTCVPAAEICGNGVDEDCNGADLQCPTCSQGIITARCNCGGSIYSSGYCCNNVYSSTPCPTGNYTKLTIKGKVRKNTMPPQACYPDCKITMTFVDSANLTNTATAFNYTDSTGNFTLILQPVNKFSSGYHTLNIVIEKNNTRSLIQRNVYIR